MADFLSQYTGQQIETILGQVENKLNKTSVVTTFSNDSESPGAASLSFQLNNKVTTLETNLGNYMSIDKGDQVVNGTKSFQSVINANKGIVVASGNVISQVTEPTTAAHVVNLSFLRKHGVSEDTASATSGLSISLLSVGYMALNLDVSRLTAYTGTDAAVSFPVLTPAGTTGSWSIAALKNDIFADDRFDGYVTTSDFTSFQTANTAAIGAKVSTSTYNSDRATIEAEIATKQDLAKTASLSVAASASTAISPDFTLVNCLSMLVTATWGTVIDVYRFTVGRDGTVKTEILIQKSTAGVLTATGSVVSGKLHVVFANANTTTTAVVDYKVTASF